MDGHECTEILFSQLERTNRLDSEFYKKKSLQIVSLLQGMKATPLTTCVDVSDGNHMGISDKFIEEGIPYYRGQDIFSKNPYGVPPNISPFFQFLVLYFYFIVQLTALPVSLSISTVKERI